MQRNATPMDASAKIYQDFEPRFDWAHHSDSHVVIVPLLGFRSNQLKVQVTSTGKLRLSGERRLGSGKWLRFRKEIDVPADADTEKISARLEDGMLFVKHPKKGTASTKPQEQEKPKVETRPPAEAPAPKVAAKPTADPQPARENASKSRNDRPAAAQANGKRAAPPPKPQEPTKPKEETTAAPSWTENPAPPPKPQERTKPKEETTAAPSWTEKPAEKPPAGAQPIQGAAPKTSTEKQTDDKPKARAKLKDALVETRQEEKKEASGSKMAEKEEEKKQRDGEVEEKKGKRKEEGHEKSVGGVAAEMAEKNREATVNRHGSGIFREGFKGVVDEMVKEMKRTKMVSLALGVVVVVIFFLNVSKKANVEGEGL